MDAVARDGKMIMHVVSEHVENAGVHSGDATLIVPPQDLDPETIRRIVVATSKIGSALNITGPYNIQFIAKDNEIKVIECNVRASRSFPFVSKATGVDLIEMATKAITNQPVTPYPIEKMPEKFVAVKVPQFSFSRLSGADPVLGVEMASTGEVATFGHDKYEAYMKALIATGMKIPHGKKNILLSIGSYKEKTEMLPTIQKLHDYGFKLFATAGTADFIQEHGIPVKYLEVLPKEDDEKHEYSLTQHLANNLIDLYINLPSNNRFRRPASYMSKGYRTRRMAVDYAIPLITNVKCAKLFIEAIVRDSPLEVGNVDTISSHHQVTLPGLVNVATFVPSLFKNKASFEDVSKASLLAGFTMNRVLPGALDGSIVDAQTLQEAQEVTSSVGYTDFNLSITATEDNAGKIARVANNVGSLVIPFNAHHGNVSKVAQMAAHFKVWPTSKPIVTDAQTTDLASILLLASLYNRPVHVCNVTSASDIQLIAMSKDKNLPVTCDVSVYSLFLSQEDIPQCKALPTKEDQAALWENLKIIDIFSVGALPSKVATDLGRTVEAGDGIAEALPLLLTAVKEGKLTIEDIVLRFHTNPVKVFELHDQPNTLVEVDLDRPAKTSNLWQAISSKTLYGGIERVDFCGQTAAIEDALVVKAPLGRDMSTHRIAPVAPSTPAVGKRSGPAFSFSGERPTEAELYSVAGSPALQSRSTASAVPEDESAVVDDSAVEPVKELAPPSVLSYVKGNNPFLGQNIVSVAQFHRSDLHLLFTLAQELRRGVEKTGVLDILKGRVLATLFYEPSTRTSASFNAAMQRLGGRVLPVSTDTASVKKGESLQDSVRTLGCYADAVVLRHPEESSADIAAKFSQVPIINAGNGSREHPTQALLDMFTIREELGTVNGITVTFMGDLRYGRTVHSLTQLLQHYKVKVQLVCPKELSLPEYLIKKLEEKNMLAAVSETLSDDILAQTDVLYCTRVQKERFSDLSQYERLKDVYIVDNDVLSRAKKHMYIMHPLPRLNEIREEVDFDHRAAYFRQMRYGLFVRMALLTLILGTDM